jgi:P27 family predicted phage terminase small subunit
MPTQLKILRGNPGRRKLPGDEPRPKVGAPHCPSFLDATAKSIWRALAPELARLGLLTIVDGGALAGYCQAWAEFEIATKTLRKEGRFFKTESGYLAPHPAVAQQRSALTAIRAFAGLFGLDPSSRSRIHAPTPPADQGKLDEFDAFMSS